MRCRRLTKRYERFGVSSWFSVEVSNLQTLFEKKRYFWSEKCLAIKVRESHDNTYLLVSHLVADLNYIRGNTIFKDFDSLRSLYVES